MKNQRSDHTGWRAISETHVMGTIKETARNSEVIHFELDLGPTLMMKLLFIANIPDEGQTQAPVYVKVLVP